MKKLVVAGFTASLMVASFAVTDAAAAAGNARVACKGDYQRLCNNVSPGGGRIMQCFKEHASELSAPCKAALADAKTEQDKQQGGTTPAN